ncbi:MAG: class I SAM-dependent methyltransferase [Phycisphaeraceae bacterium]
MLIHTRGTVAVTSKDFWDKIAAKYDRKTVKGPNYAARIERASRWIGSQAIVLDAGCAGGQITIDLASHVRRIVGIDLSPKLIALAERRREASGVENARFVSTTADDPQFALGSFDAVTAYSLLHLVDNQRETLDRFAKLLRPGGTLVLEIPCKEDIGPHFRLLIKILTMLGKAPVVTLYTQAQNEEMLRDAGFEIREIKVYNPKSMNRSIYAIKA